ncbi:hypothetical protein J1N35_032267 [Gossypium stocksii]|uniref:Methyltransferase type 11 domain-containing protein n=1 Tax=Gossypium stocksii TaxID=47602 RepID=A0A9D3V3I6_9ROSI|nr:hypothetical protein J1N35_032267 [Gossypium stocksii]
MEPIARKLSLLRNILERALLFGVFFIVIRFTYIVTISGISSPHSKSLCIETTLGLEVFALKKVGVEDLIGIFHKATKPLVIKGEGHQIPFGFIFSGGARLDISAQPFDFASEIARTLKPEGFAVLHTKVNDTYSFNSFLDLFSSCKLVKVFEIGGFNPSMPYIREIVLKKENEILNHGYRKMLDGDSDNKCFI